MSSSAVETDPPRLSAVRRSLAILLPVVYAAAFALMAWWLDRRMLGVAPDAYFGWFVLGNALPGLVFAVLLTALTRRPLLSFLLTAGLQAAIYHASALKMAVLNDPIGLQDLYFVTSIDRSSLSLLADYIDHPVLIAVLALLALAVIALLWRIEKPAFRALRWTQLTLAALSIGMIVTLVGSNQPWAAWYARDTVRPSRFESLPAILHSGLMSNLVYTHNKNMRTFDTVDAPALKSMLHAVEFDTSPVTADAVRPDVVVILSESLFDPSIMKGMEQMPDTIPNLRTQIQAGHGGNMKVPTFGGGTIRTEFEILTGMPMDAFPTAQFPYVTLVRGHIPGLVSALEKHGYATVAVHGNSGSFWNRQNAYKAIGFDRFITQRQFPANAEHNGRWISDAVMTDLVLEQLRTASGPTFVFGISMETHGPFKDIETTDRAARDAVQVPATLSPVEALELRNYLYHAHRADAQFGRLLRALKARKRPTVLLFFGDHLPGIRDVFETQGFHDGRAATKQYVPWVLVDTAHPEATTQHHAEAWMLPGLLLKQAGLQDDPYFALTEALSRRIQADTGTLPPALFRGLDSAAIARINGTLPIFLAAPIHQQGTK